MKRRYTVSQDSKSGLWYAHHKKYPHIPVCGSFSESKWEAMQYARMYDNLPHRVQEIEDKRRAQRLADAEV